MALARAARARQADLTDRRSGARESWITLYIAAILSTRRPWPDGTFPPQIVNTLLLTAEDGQYRRGSVQRFSRGAGHQRVRPVSGHGAARSSRSMTPATCASTSFQSISRPPVSRPMTSSASCSRCRRSSQASCERMGLTIELRARNRAMAVMESVSARRLPDRNGTVAV
jgi:hypothetical protein